MASFNITLTDLPSKIRVPLGKTGRYTEVDVESISKFPMVAKAAFLNGFTSALGDISRGFSDEAKTKQNTDDVWAAARDKRVTSWERGDWASKERGDSNLTFVKEQYVFEQMVKGVKQSEIDKSIKGTVARIFGEDAKATFDMFMKALARDSLGAKAEESKVADLADSIEAALHKRATARAEETKAAAAKIVVPDLSELLGLTDSDDDDEAEAA